MEIATRSSKARKGQAAMEYLVTYGWALLVLVIVIGVLVATGIFSPANFQPEECNFQPDFPCASYISFNDAAGATHLIFNASNGFGFPIMIENVSARPSEASAYTSAPAFPLNITRQGSTVQYDIKFPQAEDAGKLESYYVTVTFRNCYLNSSTAAGCLHLPEHVITGRLTTRINQG